MFKNLTVAMRLALGFGATVLLGVGIVAYAAFSMHALNDNIDELANDRLVKVVDFTTLKGNLQEGASTARKTLAADGPQAASGAKSIADLRAANTAVLQRLDKMVVTPKGRENLKLISETMALYDQGVDKAMALSAQGNKDGAAAHMAATVAPLQDQLFKSLATSVRLQNELVQNLAKSSSSTADQRVLAMSCMALLMVLISAVVGWLLVRSLRTALGAEPAELSAAVARVAGGNLGQPLQARPGDTTSVLADVARMQASLASLVHGVRCTSDSVATASAEIAQGNLDLSQRTEEQASALQQTAATMEQLSTTVRNNADSARQANQLALGATAVAAQGGEVVGKVVSTMQGITDSSRKIGDIIGVIDGIAFQTNILALNAAVEAARAGEQGRGFAVVASEVRTLAQRSAEAAKDIKNLIGRSVEQVEQGTLLVDQAGKTMGEIVGSIQRVSDIVAEITTATVEQSTGIAQVGDAVSQMDQVTQQNAALVEQSAAAAASLQAQAEQLVRAMAVFDLGAAGAGAGAGGAAAAAPAAAATKQRTTAQPAKPAKPARTDQPNQPNQPTAAAKPAAVAAATGNDAWETF